MRLIGFPRFVVRAVVAILALLMCAFGLSLAEQWRTEAELSEVLSTYLSGGILRGVHDWGSGQGILVVLQLEPHRPGRRGSEWVYPFDKRFTFPESAFATRCSFALNNAFPTHFQLVLHLPSGVKTVMASRDDLERTSFSGNFQARFPNNLGYVATSRAGFNFDRTEAIFYLDHFCGLCGGGRYVLMRKVNGNWKVIDEHHTWVS